MSFSVKEGTDLSGQVNATDTSGDTLTYSVTSNPTRGSLPTFNPNGSFVYRPTPGVTGDDSFGVQVTDSGGNRVNGTVTISVHANRAPVATGDVVRADGAALDSINVLTNDTDADSDTLTVTIEGTPLVGTATVNTNSTVRISDLPSGFKGVTRFRYRVTDTSGASTLATAAVFVGTEPFRVFFAGEATGGGTEVFVNNLSADASAVTSATDGNMRLKGFAVSENGATVVYRREDSTSPSTMDLYLVQTASPGQGTKITLPAGATLPADADGRDQFRVSPDGKWVALVLRVGGVDSVNVLNVASPGTLTSVSPAGAAFASRLRFSPDSQNLYFLASAAGGANKTLYTVTPASPVVTTTVSAVSAPSTSDDVLDYRISQDQSRVLLQANRGGRVGLYFVDPRQLQTEVQVNQVLAFGESLANSTLSLDGGTVFGAPLLRVGYTVQTLLGAFHTYVAEVSATPNPRLVSANSQAVGLRPDDGALLYSKGLQIWEHGVGAGTSDQLVEAGSGAWYDSTGNIVLVRQFLPYPSLVVTSRGAFGSSQPLGTPGLADHYVDVSGFDRGVVIVGEGATSGAAPTSPELVLVNALAPDKVLNLADFGSPQQLTSRSVQVTTN